MLPALDDPPLGRRAPGSERTSGAGAQVAVAVEFFRRDAENRAGTAIELTGIIDHTNGRFFQRHVQAHKIRHDLLRVICNGGSLPSPILDSANPRPQSPHLSEPLVELHGAQGSEAESLDGTIASRVTR